MSSAILAGAFLVAAQATSVRVVVLDPSGARIPSARVAVACGKDGPAERRADRNGEAAFTKLDAGPCAVAAVARGFDPREVRNIALAPGENRIEIELAIARVVEDLKVSPKERASASAGSASVLTEDQIAALPDDPEEMEEALRRMAGPGAVLRVNGFQGGRLPPKSQIRQIRFQMNAFAAEHHDMGMVRIDVSTKPGLGSWQRSTRLALRDERLNARAPLAPERAPESYQRLGLSIDGPLRPQRTSLALSADARLGDSAQTITAVRPEGPYSALFPTSSDKVDLSARIEHAWGKTHSLRVEYQRNGHVQEGLGVGGFDLPERAYGRDWREHLMRVSDSGALSRRVVGETRLQVRVSETKTAPASTARAVQVNGAFTGGGAQVQGAQRAAELELAQDFDLSQGRHALRAGVLAQVGRYRSDEARNAEGTFVFANLRAYELARPAVFRQIVGDSLVEYSHAEVGLYLQDEIRLSPRASLSVGLRYEAQSHLDDAGGLAPRLGAVWSPSARTTIRIGAGVFKEWYEASLYEQTLRVDGVRQAETTISDPGYPDPFASGDVSQLPPGRIQASQGLRMAEVRRASLSVEQSVGERVRLRADYSFDSGVRQYRARDANLLVPGADRPDPTSGNVTEIESSACSRRHRVHLNLGMMAGPQRRASAFVGYVFTHGRNEANGPTSLPAKPEDPAAEWGPGLQDVAHRVYGFATLRIGRGLSAGLMLNAQSGAIYDVSTGRDDNGDTHVIDRPRGVTRNTGRGASQLNLDLRLSWSRGFGTRKSPTSPVPMTRLIRIKDGEIDGPMDAGSPDQANSRYRLGLYAQAMNALNHTNVTAYSGVVSSPCFGQPIDTMPGRRIEVGVTFGF
jgi:hypothetical protein